MNDAMASNVVQLESQWKVYPAYKDSSIEWLGEIPYEWEIYPLKRGFDVRLGKMLQNEPSSSDDTLEPYLRAANITWRGVDLSDLKEMWFSPGEKQKYELNSGDLLISEGGDVGRSAIWREELPHCYIQNAINRVRSNSSSTTLFLFYWIYTLKEYGYIDILCSKSTISHFTAEKVKEVPVVFPSPSEQRIIANFLDHETAKIDALIAKKERLIELLTEKRTALISHAVTKGLDPTVPMKDSGVEWIGEIPAHWNIAPGYARYNVQLGKMLDAKRISGEHLAPYLRNIDVQWDRVNIIGLPAMDFSPSDRLRFALTPGDLLVCEGGEIGRAAIWNGELEECYYQKALHRLRPFRPSDVPRFFFYVLFTVAKMGVFIATGNPNTIDHLTAEKLRLHRFPFPSSKEQQNIADFLDHEITKIYTIIAKIREHIEKLKEYRTAIISAAVTGKIDVRSEVA